MALVKFMTGSSANFQALAQKDNDTLYFLNDTKQIYKGSELYSKAFEVVSVLPTTGVTGVLYVETSTKKLHTWNGSAFVEALDAFVTIDGAVAEGGANAVSGKAVYEFVAGEIAKLTGGSTNAFVTSIIEDNTAVGQFKVQKGTDEPTVVKVSLNGLAQAPSYDAEARKFTFPVIGGDAVEVNLGKDLVVKSGSYDTANQEIVLTLVDDTTIKIPVGDLVDIYTASADETGAVKVTIANNEVKAAVVVDGATIKNDNGVLKADFSTLALASTVEALTKRVGDAETAITNLNTNLTKAIGDVDAIAKANQAAIADLPNTYAKTADLTANYYNKTDIDGKVQTLNGAISGVDSAWKAALTWTNIEG